MRIASLVVALACAHVVALTPRPARACGGLACNSTAVVQPPSQSGERILFVVNPEGHTTPPAGIVDPVTLGQDGGNGGEAPTVAPASVDAYIEIAYQGAAAEFAWIIPTLAPPTVMGTAEPAMFDEIDAATAPRFTFTYAQGSASVSEASGAGCGGSGEAVKLSGPPEDARHVSTPEVTVVSSQRVGPYDMVVLQSQHASELLSWLGDNGYDFPMWAEPIVAAYVNEGKTFVAARLSDGQGVGAIRPVVLRIPNPEPCIPLRLTPIAAEPIVDVTALVFAPGVAAVQNFATVRTPGEEVRPTSSTTTDYTGLLRSRVSERAGKAVVLEYAGDLSDAFLADPTLVALRDRYGYVSRIATRIAPEEMDEDPIFVVGAEQPRVDNDVTIDITDDEGALNALGVNAAPQGQGVRMGAGGGGGGGGDDDGVFGCSSRVGELDSQMLPVWLVGAALLVLRRRAGRG